MKTHRPDFARRPWASILRLLVVGVGVLLVTTIATGQVTGSEFGEEFRTRLLDRDYARAYAMVSATFAKTHSIEEFERRLEKLFGELGPHRSPGALRFGYRWRGGAPARGESRRPHEFENGSAILTVVALELETGWRVEAVIVDSDVITPDGACSHSNALTGVRARDCAPCRSRFERSDPKDEDRPLPLRTPGISKPTLVEKIEPAYPDAQKREGLEAHVEVRGILRKTGTIDSIRATRCLVNHVGFPFAQPKYDRECPAFEAAAIEAVSRWRYDPARLEGQPVDVYYAVAVPFQLDGPRSDP